MAAASMLPPGAERPPAAASAPMDQRRQGRRIHLYVKVDEYAIAAGLAYTGDRRCRQPAMAASSFLCRLSVQPRSPTPASRPPDAAQRLRIY